MPDFLFHLSDFKIFLLLIGITISFSLLSILFCKYFIFFRLRYKDNVTIASISSLIGIIYGVLVAFVALYLLDNNDHAATAVLHEANAVANVYRDSQWLQEPTRSKIRDQLESYSERVIHIEWPAMQVGKDVDAKGDDTLQLISELLQAYPAVKTSDSLIVQDVLMELKTLYNSRHERISLSASQLSPQIWEVILMGTILIIGINYAFRVNFYLHLFAISAFAIMAASMLFLLVTLDRPFQGEFIIEPEAYQSVLNFMQRGPQLQLENAVNPRVMHHPHIHSFHRE